MNSSRVGKLARKPDVGKIIQMGKIGGCVKNIDRFTGDSGELDRECFAFLSFRCPLLFTLSDLVSMVGAHFGSVSFSDRLQRALLVKIRILGLFSKALDLSVLS